jgi:hypothetical protein
LILGPLFVGYFITVFSKNPMLWFISFGSTSAVLVLASFLILGTRVRPTIPTADGRF